MLALERFIFPATAWISRIGLFYREIHFSDSLGLDPFSLILMH